MVVKIKNDRPQDKVYVYKINFLIYQPKHMA